MKFKKSDLIEILIITMIILNCRGFVYLLPIAMQGLSVHIFKVMTLLSFFIIMIKKLKVLPTKFLLRYFLFIVFLFLVPEMLLSITKYKQSIGNYLLGFDGYFVLFWTILFVYVFRYKEDIHTFLGTTGSIITIGYILLIINVYLQAKSGCSFFKIEEWNISHGHIRITDTSAFVSVVVFYYWSKILNKENILKNIARVVIILSGFIYVDRSRMPFYAMLGSMFIMALLYHKENVPKLITWIISLFVGVLAVGFGMVGSFINQFSIENNGLSTLARISESKFYFEMFLKKPFYGMGIAQQKIFYKTLGIEVFDNKNFEDIGIIGLLGVIGGVGVVIMFIVPLVRWLYVLNTSKQVLIDYNMYELCVGICSYVVFTSITYIIVNYQRAPAIPLYMAIFEVIHATSNRKCQWWRIKSEVNNYR